MHTFLPFLPDYNCIFIEIYRHNKYDKHQDRQNRSHYEGRERRGEHTLVIIQDMMRTDATVLREEDMKI